MKSKPEEKLLPYNCEAEEGVLGSILIDPDVLDDVVSVVKPTDFYREANAWVFEACIAVRGKVNQITVAEQLERDGRLEAVGGRGKLSVLIERTPTSIHAVYYADIVRRLAIDRQIINAAAKIAVIGYEAAPDVDAALVEIRQIVDGLMPSAASSFYGPKEQADVVMGMLEHKDDEAVVKSGYPNLDALTGGMADGTLNILAARTRIGKSQLALEMAQYNVKKGIPVLYVSAEMTLRQLMERVVAMGTGIEVIRLATYRVTPDEEPEVVRMAAEVSEQPLYVHSGGITPESMMYWAKKLKETAGLRMVILDYVQIAARSMGHAYGPDLRQRVGYLTAFLKRLAIELQLPVIAVAQINRTPETTEDKRPRIENLKESSTIEEDADSIILLHRPELAIADPVERQQCEQQGTLEVHVAKHRQLGIDDIVRLQWQPTHHRYGVEDMTHAGTPDDLPRFEGDDV